MPDLGGRRAGDGSDKVVLTYLKLSMLQLSWCLLQNIQVKVINLNNVMQIRFSEAKTTKIDWIHWMDGFWKPIYSENKLSPKKFSPDNFPSAYIIPCYAVFPLI